MNYSSIYLSYLLDELLLIPITINDVHIFQADIWALGCILYYLCYLKHPFEDSAKLRYDEVCTTHDIFAMSYRHTTCYILLITKNYCSWTSVWVIAQLSDCHSFKYDYWFVATNIVPSVLHIFTFSLYNIYF